MKKLLVCMLLSLMAAGCGKEEAASGGEMKPTEAAEQEEAAGVTEAPEEDMPVPMEEDPVTEDADITQEDAADEDATAGDKEEAVLENDYFRASLKSFETDSETDSVTVVFEFENITDKTYYKNDEEILPGATWEKTIMYPTEKWEKEVGKKSWIHYDLYEFYDGEQEPFFSGGLCFSVAEDLSVTDMELFTE